jgi:hypothetical protein
MRLPACFSNVMPAGHRCRTLSATHYKELGAWAEELNNAACYKMLYYPGMWLPGPQCKPFIVTAM